MHTNFEQNCTQLSNNHTNFTTPLHNFAILCNTFPNMLKLHKTSHHFTRLLPILQQTKSHNFHITLQHFTNNKKKTLYTILRTLQYFTKLFKTLQNFTRLHNTSHNFTNKELYTTSQSFTQLHTNSHFYNTLLIPTKLHTK